MGRIAIFLTLLFSVGCAHHHKKHQHAGCAHGECKKDCADKAAGGCPHDSATAKPGQASAEVLPLGKSKVKGSIQFVETAEGLKLSVNLTGLKPNQKQGFHIHEFGVCGQDGKPAGAHYNPGMKPHGAPTDEKRHAGDLGNLTADAKGAVATEITIAKARLHGLLGRSVIVHSKEDDLKTQPSGDAGDRVACGVIALTQ